MLRLTKNIDYALMAINFLACQEAHFVLNIKMLSELYYIPPELLAKVMQRLAKGGICVSKSGAKGGYLLSREAGKITLAQVIEAVEGPIRIVRCEDQECSQMERCTAREPLIRVERKIADYLGQLTVESLYSEVLEQERSFTV
jgi:Rrf2 family protein